MEISSNPFQFSILLNRWDVYRHICALCNQDLRFGIDQTKKEQELEVLTICDAQKVKELGSARGEIIGTIRLLPMDDETLIIFLNKDILWNIEITKEHEALFKKFKGRVENHFTSIGKIKIPGTEKTVNEEVGSQRKFKGGRPRDPINIWAYEQVNTHGRDPKDVYIEWKEKRGSSAYSLVNPIDSFKKVINPRKKGK